MTLTPKRKTLLAANGKTIRHEGKVYRVIAQTAGPLVLVDAEQVYPKPEGNTPVLVNLLGKNKLNMELWNLVNHNLVH